MVLFKMMRFSNTIPATFSGISQHFRVSALGKKSSESLELSLLQAHGKVVLDISWEGAGFLVGESAKPETEETRNMVNMPKW